MVSETDFYYGEIIWAKMKGYPFWPGEIALPPPDETCNKKDRHLVFFYGSNNYAWISVDNIEHHSEKMLQSAFKNKKKSGLFKIAIKRISENTSTAVAAPVKEKKDPEASTSGTERKIAKVRKMKTGKVIKKTVLKRASTSEESSNGIIPPPKSRKTEDFSELINNTPPNLTYDPVAVMKELGQQRAAGSSLDERLDDAASAESNWNTYFKLEPGPPFNLNEPHPCIIKKKVRPNDKKIGFIGLGMMGKRVVKNLFTTGHNVTIWNRTAEKCEDFAKAGIPVAQSPAALVEKCDVVFTCLSDSDASKAVMYGSCGILRGLEKCPTGTKSIIEMTTMDPNTAFTLSEDVIKKGGKYLEAPMNGSASMAEDGTLFILCAGEKEIFNDYRSCLFASSDNPYFLSRFVGSGSKMNLILSMLIGISHAALAEAMALVQRLNLSEDNFLEIMKLGPLNSLLIKAKGRAMMSRYFATDSTLKYMQKDLNMALSFGNSCQQPLPVTAAANELYKNAKVLHYSDHDVSAVLLGAR